MLERSSHKEGTVVQAEGIKWTILVSIIQLDSSSQLSLLKAQSD